MQARVSVSVSHNRAEAQGCSRKDPFSSRTSHSSTLNDASDDDVQEVMRSCHGNAEQLAAGSWNQQQQQQQQLPASSCSSLMFAQKLAKLRRLRYVKKASEKD